MSSLASVTQSHHEVDVLICGFGMAGSSAAIDAIDAEMQDFVARRKAELPDEFA